MYKLSNFKKNMTKYVGEMVNPSSYYEWLNKNTTINGVPFSCDKYAFQKQILEDMHINMSVIKCSQIGLALCLDTELPTPTGFTTMGDIKVGDKLYAIDGTETEVTYISPIYTDHPCYELTFCDGTKVVADENHKWYVECHKAFNSQGLYPKHGRIPLGTDYIRNGVANTKMIAETYKLGNRFIYAIPNAKPLQTPEVELPVSPYFLGVWLSDGHSHSCNVTAHKDDVEVLVGHLEAEGLTCRSEADKANSYTVKVDVPDAVRFNCMYSRLNVLGVIKELKHIPKQYLRASIEQRFELLRGLLDTDGSITKSGRVSFHNTSVQLIDDVYELASSLGFKPRTRWRNPKPVMMKNGDIINSVKPIAEISFMAYSDTPMFKFPRKLSRQKGREGNRTTESLRRRIVDVVAVEPRAVRCITVDHPSHLFLCTKAMVPTHNTEIQVRKALALMARNPNRNLIFTLPNQNMVKRLYQTRVKTVLDSTEVFNPPDVKQATRSIEINQIGSSHVLFFPANEQAATSQPADIVFNDEKDLSDQSVLALFNSRTQGSDWRMIQEFSTPTFTGFGISKSYAMSDQHQYIYKCVHCNHYQMPEFNSNFVVVPNLPSDLVDDFADFNPEWLKKYGISLDSIYSKCEKCHKPVKFGKAEDHRWVAKHPDVRDHRGYRVNPFATSQLTPDYIFGQLVKYKLNDNIKGFKNTVLGLEHEGADERLAESLIKSLFGEKMTQVMPDGSENFFIGIDMGNMCHISIARANAVNNVETVHFEITKLEEVVERVRAFKKIYPNLMLGFVDIYPSPNESAKVREVTERTVYPIEYTDSPIGGLMIRAKKDEYGAVSHYQVQRTLHLDKFVGAVKNGWIKFSGYGIYQEAITLHLRNMVRKIVDADGEKIPRWIKLDKQDHFFHSLGYMYQAIYQYYEGNLEAGEYQSSFLYLGGMDSNIMQPTKKSLYG